MLSTTMEAETSNAKRCNTAIAARIESGELLLDDKPSKSKIWQIFLRIQNQMGEYLKYVYCKHCHNVYKHNRVYSSSLFRHSCYVKKFGNNDTDSSAVGHEKSSVKEISFMDANVNPLEKILTNWIIDNCQSYDLIQSGTMFEVLQELLKLGAEFSKDTLIDRLLPSVSDVSKYIHDSYKSNYASLKAEIALIKENGFSLTTDIWTDNYAKENYITVTIHFLKNGAPTHRLLGFQTLDVATITSESVAEHVQYILKEFDCQLSNKCCVVTDGASDYFKDLPDAQNLSCISQLLSNAILKSAEKVPQVSQMLQDSQKLVNFLKQKNSKTLSQKLLPNCHHNRTLATCKMLNSILSNCNEIEQTLKSMNEAQIFTLNKSHLVAIIDILQPFEEAIETLEDDTNATLHLVMAYLNQLKKFCLTSNDTHKGVTFIKNLQENIHFNLEEIVMKNVTELHKVAVFLYPPTNKLLPYNAKGKQLIEDECIRLAKFNTDETKSLFKQEPIDEPPGPSCKRRKLFEDFLESETNIDSDELLRQEIKNYKNTRIAFSPNFNVFNWWELQKSTFPLLSKLSCLVLATPATSAASKQIISKAKIFLSEKCRQESTVPDIEKIMFININNTSFEIDKHS